MKTILTIEKENISKLIFAKNEVLLEPEKQKRRLTDLYRSQTLGNLLHTKVKITFETQDQQIYQVDTTVWAVGDDFVSLKGGVFIPIHSILQVD